jgi:ankyrin repeat protein
MQCSSKLLPRTKSIAHLNGASERKKMFNDIDIRGRSDCIKVLIENKANLNSKDIKQQTALHVAAANRANECVQGPMLKYFLQL